MSYIPNANDMYPTTKAATNPNPETIKPSFLFSASKGKIPSPLVAIAAAINAAIGKFGIVIKATATAIIPPQPGVTPIRAANNITTYADDVIQTLNFSAPTSISMM